jgi:hypothetical protein
LDDCSRAFSDILPGMSERDQDKDTEIHEPQEQGHDQDALDEQEGKGYGEDEGERDESFPTR